MKNEDSLAGLGLMRESVVSPSTGVVKDKQPSASLSRLI
jgi:hypothetical protein